MKKFRKARRHRPRATDLQAVQQVLEDNRWRRCGDCGCKVKLPDEPMGKCCPKCGEPLSSARSL